MDLSDFLDKNRDYVIHVLFVWQWMYGQWYTKRFKCIKNENREGYEFHWVLRVETVEVNILKSSNTQTEHYNSQALRMPKSRLSWSFVCLHFPTRLNSLNIQVFSRFLQNCIILHVWHKHSHKHTLINPHINTHLWCSFRVQTWPPVLGSLCVYKPTRTLMAETVVLL